MKRTTHDGGSAILEMAIVFPVIVFVLMIMLFFGMLLYEQVASQAILNDVASKAAANWATAEHGIDWEVPPSASYDVWRVYWRLLDMQKEAKRRQVESAALQRLRRACLLKDSFRAEDIRCVVSGNPVYRTIRLDVDRTFTLPFGAVLDGISTERRYHLQATAIIQDTPEMIRNVDFAYDIAKKAGLKAYLDKLDKITTDIGEFFSNLSK